MVGNLPSPVQVLLQDEPQSLLFFLSLLEGKPAEPPGVRILRRITLGEKMGDWGLVNYLVQKGGGIHDGAKTGGVAQK